MSLNCGCSSSSELLTKSICSIWAVSPLSVECGLGMMMICVLPRLCNCVNLSCMAKLWWWTVVTLLSIWSVCDMINMLSGCCDIMGGLVVCATLGQWAKQALNVVECWMFDTTKSVILDQDCPAASQCCWSMSLPLEDSFDTVYENTIILFLWIDLGSNSCYSVQLMWTVQNFGRWLTQWMYQVQRMSLLSFKSSTYILDTSTWERL